MNGGGKVDLLMVKGCLFAMLLIVASYIDIKTRTIPDWIHVLIMLVALIDIDWVDSLIGFALVPLPFFIMACVKEGSIGGGDVKLVGACGFYFGFIDGIQGITLSLIIVITTMIFYITKDTLNKLDGFPFAPYLTIGCWSLIF